MVNAEPMEPVPASRQAGEFGLVDYARVVWRWRWLVVAGTLLGVLSALLVAMLAGSTYRAVAVVDAGDLREARDRDLDRLVARLNAGLADQPGSVARGGPARVTLQFKRPYMLEVSVESQHPADTMAAMQRVTTAALAELNNLHELQRTEESIREWALQSRLDLLRREQSLREGRLQALRRSVEQLQRIRAAWTRPPSDDTVAALILTHLSEQIASRELALAQLEDQIKTQGPREVADLERQIKLARLSSQARPPHLTVVPPPSATSRRRLVLPLALGAVVGLAASVLLAMSCEYASGPWRRAAPARQSAGEPGS
jgi:hypothetical protein